MVLVDDDQIMMGSAHETHDTLMMILFNHSEKIPQQSKGCHTITVLFEHDVIRARHYFEIRFLHDDDFI